MREGGAIVDNGRIRTAPVGTKVLNAWHSVRIVSNCVQDDYVKIWNFTP